MNNKIKSKFSEKMKIYDEVIELRNRISNDGDGKIYEEDYLLLDRVLDKLEHKEEDFLLKLLNEIDYIFDNNKGSFEIVVGNIILNDENEKIIVRLHKKEV